MKRNFYVKGMLLACLIYFQNSHAAESANPLSTTINRSTIDMQENTKDSKPKEGAKIESMHKVALPTPSVKKLNYFHPGILVYVNDQWQGSDHLLNLTNNIGVYVKILKPEGDTLDIKEEKIQNVVEEIFKQTKIRPQTLAYADKAPLPAFEIEILIYPVDKGYVACCDGRLFESVTLSRFIMDPGMAFQAITWEKRTLIVGPKSTFIQQLENSTKEIAQAFADRFQLFEQTKNR